MNPASNTEFQLQVEDFSFENIILLCFCLKDVPRELQREKLILRSRQTIFTHPNVISSPIFEHKAMYVIMQKEYYHSSKWESYIQQSQLTLKSTNEVGPNTFKECLKYTLKAKLAPEWNYVIDYYVQGRNFLTNYQKKSAIHMDLTVTNSEILLHLNSFCVKLHRMFIENLMIDSSILQKFALDNQYVIKANEIPSRWCHVLPSMKMGEIISITHSIPKESAIKSYADLKKYWKNNYGYRLPDEEPNAYYNINFKMIGENVFTYPEYCVRNQKITTLPCMQKQATIDEFLQQLYYKVGNVCGQFFNIEPLKRLEIQTASMFLQMKLPSPGFVPKLSKTPPIENISQKISKKIKEIPKEPKNYVYVVDDEQNRKMKNLTTPNGISSKKVTRRVEVQGNIKNYFETPDSKHSSTSNKDIKMEIKNFINKHKSPENFNQQMDQHVPPQNSRKRSSSHNQSQIVPLEYLEGMNEASSSLYNTPLKKLKIPIESGLTLEDCNIDLLNNLKSR